MASCKPYRRMLWLAPVVVLIAVLMLSSTAASASQSAIAASGVSTPSAATAASSLTTTAAPTTSVPLSSSSAPSTSQIDSLLQSNPSVSHTPWIEELASGQTTGLVSLPNLDLLTNPAKAVDGEVSPAYTTQPAPTGLADFGIGPNGAYAMNVTHILGQLNLNAPPNVTNPGAQAEIDPGASHLGSIGSPYTYGLQLNTILQNISLPGVTNGTFWTQNVVNLNSSAIHFVQDIFNFTYNSGAYIAPGTTISEGCGSTNLVSMLEVYGGVYQCVGGSIPVVASDYPISLSLYNNVTVNATTHEQVLTFGYNLVEYGTGGTNSSGVIDTVIFTGTASSAHPPAFTINGFTTNPFGLYNDAEIVAVGGIGGSNAVFTSFDGTFSLQYTNTTSDWKDVPSAYDFGSDTGETSTGVASYWTGDSLSGYVDHANAGPDLLYGLWNSPAGTSVASGDIELSGTLTPGYGFVFAGNVVQDLLGTNLSYLPTTTTGSFTTYVPTPTAGTAVTGWYIQAWAAAYDEYNSSTPITTTTSLAITLTKSAHLTLDAPLYMNGDAQAASLANNVTKATAPPYIYSGLIVNPNITFRHVNDYGFPSFEIFQAENVNDGIQIDNVTQSNTSTTYVYDSPAKGFFPSPPEYFHGLQNYSQQFNLFHVLAPLVTNETLPGVIAFKDASTQGGSVFLWNDAFATAANTTVEDASYAGIFVGQSYDTYVTNIFATGGSNGVDDVGSYGTWVNGLTANGSFSFGVYGLSSAGGLYENIYAENGSYGVYAGGYFGGGLYYAEFGVTDTTICNVLTDAVSTGVVLFFPYEDEVFGSETVVAEYPISNSYCDGSYGGVFYAAGDEGVYIVDAYAGNGSRESVEVDDSAYVYVISPTSLNDSEAVAVYDSELVLATGVYAANYSDGTYISDSDYITADSYPLVFGTVYAAEAVNGSVGLYLAYNFVAQISNVSAWDLSVGVYLDDEGFYCDSYYNSETTITSIFATESSAGVYIEHSSGVTVSGVTATNFTLDASNLLPFYDTPFFWYWDAGEAGVVSEFNYLVTITDVSATNYPFAVWDDGSSYLTVSNVNATGGYEAVQFDGTSYSLISNVTAFQDYIGVEIGCGFFAWYEYGYCQEYNGAYYDTVTQSTFFDDTSYGVYLGTYFGNNPGENWVEETLVFYNNFINNNGATTTDYNQLGGPLQAFDAGEYNDWAFDETGNYWSNWHVAQADGSVPPLVIAEDEAIYGYGVDYSPLTSPVTSTPETFTVTFTETGLSSGTSWSAVLNGVVGTSNTASITFSVPAGTYQFQVPGIAGYAVLPGSGSITVTGSYTVAVTFSTVAYAVSIEEAGLPLGTVWSATLDGQTITTNETSATFFAPNGTYTYSVSSVSGYSITAGTGNVTVSGHAASQSVGYAKIPSPATSLFGLSPAAAYAVYGGTAGVGVVAGVAIGAKAGLFARKP